jgi:hypothetical protein
MEIILFGFFIIMFVYVLEDSIQFTKYMYETYPYFSWTSFLVILLIIYFFFYDKILIFYDFFNNGFFN